MVCDLVVVGEVGGWLLPGAGVGAVGRLGRIKSDQLRPNSLR